MALLYSDYWQFVITGPDRGDLAIGHSGDLGIVQVDPVTHWIQVITGGRSVPADVVVVEAHSDPPALDLTWDDVVEFDCVSDGGIYVGELMDGTNQLRLVGADGPHRIRVSARGRDAGLAWSRANAARGELEPNPDPVEFYRVDAWPAAASIPQVVRLTSLPEDRPIPHQRSNSPMVPDELASAAAAAAQYIGDVLDRRPFTPPATPSTGVATATHVVHGLTMNKLVRHMKQNAIVTCGGCEWDTGAFAYGYLCFLPDEHPEDRFLGRWGQARGTNIAVKRSGLVERTWNWYVRPTVAQELEYSDAEVIRFPIPETIFRIEIEAVLPGSQHNGIKVNVIHQNLPADFAEPMSAIWRNALRKIETRVADLDRIER